VKKLLKLLGFDPNKTYRSKIGIETFQGKVTCRVKCPTCVRFYNQTGKRKSITCQIYTCIGRILFLPGQIEEVKGTDMFGTTVALEALSIVEKYVATDKMFTCFDVTKELRNRTHKVFHSDVRDFVHGLNSAGSSAFGGYKRFTHTFGLNNGVMTAELYADPNNDLDDYDPYDVLNDSDDTKADNSDASPAPVPVVPDVAPAVFIASTRPAVVVSKSVQKRLKIQKDSSAPTPSNRTSRDARGRLCIPNAMVRKLGLKSGDMAYVHRVNLGIMVRADLISTDMLVATLKVDKDTNIRVTNAALKKANIGSISYTPTLNVNGGPLAVTISP